MTDYEGFAKITLTGDQINTLFAEGKLYEADEDGELAATSLGCLENEYMYAFNEEDDEIGIFKCMGLDEKEGPYFQKVKFIAINNEMVGKIKPRNKQQEMAMDLLMDDKTTIKVLTGKFGTGERFAPLHSDM